MKGLLVPIQQAHICVNVIRDILVMVILAVTSMNVLLELTTVPQTHPVPMSLDPLPAIVIRITSAMAENVILNQLMSASMILVMQMKTASTKTLDTSVYFRSDIPGNHLVTILLVVIHVIALMDIHFKVVKIV